ncbi:hypothetical protein LSAT2_020240 [Lamellibrachia satsuma]|nr:hypothetical protein LSAT2_020240 [Lamellibrachia satsuma]
MKSGVVLVWCVLFVGLVDVTNAWPHRPALCFWPADIGWGPVCTERWYYNWRTITCDKFYYRGCGGNWNSFKSKNACYMKCIFGHRD